MKKRRFPSLRRPHQDDEAGVGFEDLPPDEKGSEVVTHPAPGAAGTGGEDDTKPRPSMPASAVVVHDADTSVPEEAISHEDSDYLFRPPGDVDDQIQDPSAGDLGAGFGPEAIHVPDVVVDADVRADVLASTGVSTFVDGPPGSGISTLLVARVVAALRSGLGGDSVAIVTGNRTDAAQVRDRLRDLLEAAAAGEEDEVRRRRLGATVGQLRSAPIGTGPEIAAAILGRWPEAAGIPPGFEVVAPHVARLEFERDFETWLAGQGGHEPAVSRALARGVTPGQIHDLAEAITRHFGLIPSVGATAAAEGDPATVFGEIEARIDELGTLARHGSPDDAGVVQIRRLQAWLSDASGLDADESVGHFMVNAPTKVRQAGSRAHWDPPEMCTAQMEGCRDLARVWVEARRGFGRGTLSALLEAIVAFVDTARVERVRAGRLFPTDVLPTAVALLARDAAVRRVERERHRLVVVDDVWDIDAASLALLLVLTSLDDDVDEPFRLRPGPGRLLVGGTAITSTGRSRGADQRLVTRLRERGMTPMRLSTSFRASPALLAWTTSAFHALVNDDGDAALQPNPAVPAPAPPPPVSDDADVDSSVEAEVEAGSEAEAETSGSGAPDPGTQPVHAEESPAADPNAAVATNEIPLPKVDPAAATILTPEGHALAAAPLEDAGTAAPESGDSESEALTHAADEAPAAEVHVPLPHEWGPVVAAWVRPAGDHVADLRRAEAAAMAGALQALVGSGDPCVRLADGAMRPPRWSDCAIVLGSLAGLEQYLGALETAGVPYRRVSTGVELLRRQDVTDFLATLRAADDPDDAVSVIAALRGLAFGCSDTDLVAAVAAAGTLLRPTATPAEGTPEAVADGLRSLARLHARRHAPALEVVDLVLATTGIGASARAGICADPSHFDVLRDLVAAWCSPASGSVGSFLAAVDAALVPWIPGATTPPNQADGADAVEVLTVAEAAGRAYPVVAVANLHRLRAPMPVAVADHSAARLHLRAGPPERGFVTDGFDAALARDDEEYLTQRTRLVCAAFSRARDKLVVAVAVDPGDADASEVIPRRDLVRRVAHLLVEADPDHETNLRGGPGVTLVPVEPVQGAVPSEDPPATAPPPKLSAQDASALGHLPREIDDQHEALVLALSRVDFTAVQPPPGDLDPEIAVMVDRVLSSDAGKRARDADRVLRRPTVLLDGGAAGIFSDRLDMGLVDGGDVIGVAVTIGPAGDAARTRVALSTHALGQATGLGVGAALLVDARSGAVTTMATADVAAAVGTALA